MSGSFAPVALRAGGPARCRVYCFPPGGGTPAAYGGWARSAPPDWDLFAMPSPGFLALTGPAPDNWPDTVRRITDELTADGPPRVLFGHCLGAATATAVTVELAARGEPPLLLAVSACPATGARELFTSLDDTVLVDRLAALGMVPDGLPGAARAVTERMFRADLRYAAGCDYEGPLSASTAVTAFCGTEDLLVAAADLLAWRHRAPRYLGLRRYPAGHQLPRTHAAELVADLAADIRLCLAESS